MWILNAKLVHATRRGKSFAKTQVPLTDTEPASTALHNPRDRDGDHGGGVVVKCGFTKAGDHVPIDDDTGHARAALERTGHARDGIAARRLMPTDPTGTIVTARARWSRPLLSTETHA